MADIVIESKVRGEWKTLDTIVSDDPENMSHIACKTMAEYIASMEWPGSELRARWNETGEADGEITLLTNDPMLDDYVVEARENLKAYAEAQRHLFKSAS